MNWPFSKNMDNLRLGFTLIETLISISITIGVILLIQVLLFHLHRPIQLKTTTGDINSYLRVLESDHYQFRVRAVFDDHLNLYSPVERKNYRLFQKNQIVQLTSEHGGYIPLLDQVHLIRWNQHKHILKTEVVMTDGKQFITNSLLPEESNS